MIRRKVMSYAPDPQDGNRLNYTLECGHVVNRRINTTKQWALCGYCEPNTKGMM